MRLFAKNFSVHLFGKLWSAYVWAIFKLFSGNKNGLGAESHGQGREDGKYEATN